MLTLDTALIKYEIVDTAFVISYLIKWRMKYQLRLD